MRLFGRPIAQYAVPGVLLALTIGYVVMAFDFSPEARLVPLLVGLALLVVVPIDLVSITETSAGRKLRRINEAATPVEPDHRVPRRRQLASIGWVLAFAALIYLIGMALAIPLYVAGSMRLLGRKSWAVSIGTALATGAFSFVLFTYALDIDLYPGLLAGLVANP